MQYTASHALLHALVSHGVDRVFLVPGESYLGVLDALCDFPGIEVVTCRHEAGAGFMAVADARLARRAGVVMASRGPGAANASIAVHTAQQDAVPLVLLVGQVPVRDLRREAFQEIDYQAMFGSIAKWVFEATDPGQLGAAMTKALGIATSDTPGPVVLVVPEDIQQQAVTAPHPHPHPAGGDLLPALPSAEATERVHAMLREARRPLAIAGGCFEAPDGRAALLAFARAWNLPVALSFRRNDLFGRDDPLHAGELGLANDPLQIAAFQEADLLLALGTRLGDITTQGYCFPDLPVPRQRLVHCHPDPRVLNRHFVPAAAICCDPVALARALTTGQSREAGADGAQWRVRVRELAERHAQWPRDGGAPEGAFLQAVRSVQRHAPADAILCLDAGSFAAPVYRHFRFGPGQRMLAPLSGAMGYGVPAAVAAQLRHPARKVICLVGDGGFLMTGNEMIAAVERQLPILFLVSNNGSYASIRIHQEREYPGRDHRGTRLFNPDFSALAISFGMQSVRVGEGPALDDAVAQAMAAGEPVLVEVMEPGANARA